MRTSARPTSTRRFACAALVVLSLSGLARTASALDVEILPSGHLSLMLGMASDNGDPKAAEPFMRESDRVASVVAYYPPVDLRTMARGLVPATPDQRFPALNFEKEKAAAISPILFVTPDDPPTLLIHGDADTTVNISHSQRMIKALQENHIKSDFITLPGAGHGFRGADAEKAQAALLSWFLLTLTK